MKKKFVDTYMDIAKRFAELSYAKRLKVGCNIVKDDIMHPGYNGTPEGWDNKCEDKVWMDRGAGGWLDTEEINMRWPFEGEQIDADGVTVPNRYALKTKPEVLHAEANAMSKMMKAGMSTKDADVFVTHAPCIHCAKMLYQGGVRSVTYEHEYRDTAGIEFLKLSGIDVHQYSNGA